MTRWRFARVAWLMIATACHPAISTTPPPSHPGRPIAVDRAETEHCLRVMEPLAPSRPESEGPRRDPDSLTILPVAIRRAAVATETDRVLEALASEKVASVSTVELRLEAFTRLSSLELELAALLFEADCEGDQMEAALEQIDARQRRQEVAFAVSSIVVGAVAGIGVGVYELADGRAAGIPVIGIVGGAAAAGLGLAAFAPVRAPVAFTHPKNLLRPIVEGEDPDGIYPSFVFRLLTMPTHEGGPTPRELLLADFDAILVDEIAEKQRALARKIVFGEGGTYDAELLAVRERMFDALESQLAAQTRELELLYRFADGVVADAPASAPSP